MCKTLQHQNLVVTSFTEIKTGYRGYETKQNLVFHVLVLFIENYSQAYIGVSCKWKWLSQDIIM